MASSAVRRDVHTYTRSEGVAGLPGLVHTPEVDQRKAPGPPHWARQPVSLEGRSSRSGLLLFHRAIRTVEVAKHADSGVSIYARFTQRLIGRRLQTARLA
jgi:hypothetical protein